MRRVVDAMPSRSQRVSHRGSRTTARSVTGSPSDHLTMHAVPQHNLTHATGVGGTKARLQNSSACSLLTPSSRRLHTLLHQLRAEVSSHSAPACSHTFSPSSECPPFPIKGMGATPASARLRSSLVSRLSSLSHSLIAAVPAAVGAHLMPVDEASFGNESPVQPRSAPNGVSRPSRPTHSHRPIRIYIRSSPWSKRKLAAWFSFFSQAR